MVDGQPFILIQRKGWERAQWEAMMTIPDQRNICPWQLLQQYVALTSSQVPLGPLSSEH